ncbi:EamA family transporter [Mucilaginibacter boryungensis]|uniref:EamA family transporter n=1 Tax=Mucilaginibacter boryungensis TaxID=768480 RepID=A0ABR9XCZ1_9SPHI|nr:EamA family transporter [Mucilaginibacter boryungensis]MBE9664930.1 EamA family transporter [Mucilaginibacter boryungensis]
MAKKQGSIIYLGCAIAAAVLWGFFAFPLRRIQQYPPQQILYYRVFVSFAIVWAINLLFRKKQLLKDYQFIKNTDARTRKKLVWLFIGSGVFITGNWYTFIYVMNHINLKSAAFAYMICPIITAAGGFLLLKEQVTRPKLIAIGIAVLSVGILSTASLSQAIWSVVVALMYALYLIIQRVLNEFDKLNLLGINLFISMLVLLPFYLYDNKPVPMATEFWVVILIIAVVLTIVPLLLSTYALNGLPSSTLGITIYINPFISFTVAFVWFHEQVSYHQIAGYLLLMLAVVIFNWSIIRSAFGRKTDTTN